LSGDEPQNDGTKTSEAVDKLEKMLGSGEVPCGQLYAALLDSGISKRSVDRAKKQLNIKSTKHADGWYWSLREADHE
jgi:hypothetical protein